MQVYTVGGRLPSAPAARIVRSSRLHSALRRWGAAVGAAMMSSDGRRCCWMMCLCHSPPLADLVGPPAVPRCIITHELEIIKV
jgi:hypothetical protein